MIMLINRVCCLFTYTTVCLLKASTKSGFKITTSCVRFWRSRWHVRQELWCGNQADCKVPGVLRMALYKPWFWRFTISTVRPQSSVTFWRQKVGSHHPENWVLNIWWVAGSCCKRKNVCETLDTCRLHCLNLQSCLQNSMPIQSNHTFESRKLLKRTIHCWHHSKTLQERIRGGIERKALGHFQPRKCIAPARKQGGKTRVRYPSTKTFEKLPG